MKTIVLLTLLLLNFDLNAKIVYVEPVPNAKYVSIYNSIIIGFDETISSSRLSSIIKVTGTLSGIHMGEIILTSDKKKIIFKPYQPFVFNERVEVRLNRIRTITSLNNSLSYNFQTQINRPELDFAKSLTEEFGIPPVNRFNNVLDTIGLPAMTVNISNSPTAGDLYLSNFPIKVVTDSSLIIPNYLLTVNNSGDLTYSRFLNSSAVDFKKQPNGLLTYYPFQVLKFIAEDYHHNLIDTFACGNGYTTNMHELQIIENGHALIMSYDIETVDMSVIVPGGNPNASVTGLIIQELDQNKNVVFQWRSWDHFAITDAQHVDFTAVSIDAVHGNALDRDNDGNILLSSRNLSEITKINRTTGAIIWRLGGNNNQFTFTNDLIGFSYQHDIRRIQNGNVTLFDNGVYHTPSFSRAIEYQLNEVSKTATIVWQFRNTPDIFGPTTGSVQRLHNGNTLICWGTSNPTVSEITPAGSIAFEMTLPQHVYTYRTFRDEVNITLNVKLAIQGFYDPTYDKLNMKDTVRAYLRSINPPYNILDSSKSILDSVNLAGNFRFYNALTGAYYISTKHRNSLETWSKPGGEAFKLRGAYLYDFTSSSSNAYGNNVVLKGLKYCIFSGDVNHDNNIDLTDLISIFNDALNFVTGYVNSDVNGDRVTDLTDLIITYNNAINFVKVIRP